jgi:hypothetical protein
MIGKCNFFVTSWPRAIAGIVALIALPLAPLNSYFFLTVLMYVPTSGWAELYANKATAYSLEAYLIYALVFVSTFIMPVWIVMHMRGARLARHAMAVGFVIPAAALMIIELPNVMNFGPPLEEVIMLMVFGPLVCGIIGGMTAVLAWRIAYRRVPIPPP